MDKKGNIVEKAGELIAARTAAGPDNYCALATVDQDGYPYATTISISKAVSYSAPGRERPQFCG